MAILGPIKEMPIEIRKTIGAIAIRNVVNLIVLWFMFLSIRRWLLLEYNHVRVRDKPAAA
jgi:hypothetical protein